MWSADSWAAARLRLPSQGPASPQGQAASSSTTSTARGASPLWGSAHTAAGSATTAGTRRMPASSAQVSTGAPCGAARVIPGICK